MIVSLVGLKRIDYVSKKDNKRRVGLELQCIRDKNLDENVSGKMLFPVYISSDNRLYDRLVDHEFLYPCEIELSYQFDGRFNYLVDVSEVN